MRGWPTISLVFLCLSAGCRRDGDGPKPFFEASPGRPGFVRIAQPGTKDVEFSREKPPGTFRVFLVGCSLAQILEQEVSFSDYLRRALPARDIEVVDCGVGGHGALRTAAIVEESASYAADAVVYAGGHHHDVSSEPVRAPLWRLWVGRLLLRTRWRETGESLLPPSDAAAATSPGEREAFFAQGMRKMGQACRRTGATLLVCLPPINYRGALSHQDEDPYQYRSFIRARLLYLRRDYRGAFRAFAAAARGLRGAPGVRSLSLYYQSRCAERLGLSREAVALYREAANDPRHTGPGASPDRLKFERALAAADGDVLVDLDADLRRMSSPSLSGFDVFEDVSHWRPEVAGLIVVHILQALRAAPSLRGLPWDDRELTAMNREEERSAPRRLRARAPTELGFALAVAGTDPGQRLPWQSLAALGTLHERAPDLFASWAVIPELAARNPLSIWVAEPGNSRLGGTPARLLWSVGELLLEAGRPAEAAAALARARELEPRLDGTWLSQAFADHLLGKAAAVARDLERASAAGFVLESEALTLELKGN